ncbi:oxidoreductase [Mesotoga sp. Brook.08.105.5.1]|uniref:Gfo/Idh/MocA family protein n=1 Tax=Mesotoga sp. Brook.08.105.5.1 TaxID=1421002 RepID=UPI000C188C56|nr:Gfo/Idh/MocA family oxidoreductase [Mesotoga sp. Brook.08.105.5.1]PNQ05602.1 oxidoreductase [Mesotoga sp. SC_NapDC3]PVD17853.1 oxidoreductase [Mesotoga sp. Brook.08.105.5.1]PXF34761.1 oxidoreductase [Mesotoga sp. SC_NapDC]
MNRLRAALIGCGRIGTKKHIEAFAANSDLIDLVAVCDLVPEKAERAAEEYLKRREISLTCGEKERTREKNESQNCQDRFSSSPASECDLQRPRVISDYKNLLSADIDFVTIATESGNHYKNTIDFLSAGKHVLVEKPMALSSEHMDQMIALSREKKLKLAVCVQNRFNPPVQELRKAIDSGKFGRVFTATARILWNRNEEYYKQASWRGTWAMDGGTIMNQCAHNIDLLQWMLGGEVQEIFAMTENYNHPYIETEDFGAAIVRFKNGSIGIIEGTANVYPKNLEETLSVFGEKGTVVLGGLAVNKIQTWRFDGEDSHPLMELPDPDTVYGSGHITAFEDFARAIIEDREPFVNGEEGKKSVEIILGIYKSAREGVPVKL